MTTLHIQHEVRNFESWKAAFDQAAPMRARGNVRRYVISHPVDQPLNVLIDLEFDDRMSAESYLGLLQANVWQTPQALAAVDGGIQTSILERVEAKEL